MIALPQLNFDQAVHLLRMESSRRDARVLVDHMEKHCSITVKTAVELHALINRMWPATLADQVYDRVARMGK